MTAASGHDYLIAMERDYLRYDVEFDQSNRALVPRGQGSIYVTND